MLYMLLLLPFSMLFSCSKEEVAPFDMTLTMNGVTMTDNVFYAVSGDDVTIQGLTVKSLGTTVTDVANVVYYIDGAPLVPIVPGAPFNGTFSTEGLAPGKHTIGVSGMLLQVDHSLKSFAVNYPFVIAEDEAGLPSGAPEIGEYSVTMTFTNAD